MAGTPQHRRGALRIYLGSAPGVGKTFAMLGDARVAELEHVDVVIGYLEAHGRAPTEDQAAGLERAPMLEPTGRAADRSLDVEWLLERHPSVAVVDEFASSNPDGVMRSKRFEDVEVLLHAGIDVWTTVNIQHLESLNPRIEDLTGVRVRETFPDRLLHEADEIRLIDLSPAALRERIARGLVYPAERIDRALTGFFTVENLTALRALALHELAENAAAQLSALDPDLQARPVEHVLVAVGGLAASAERLVRIGSRIARRSQGTLTVLHVTSQARTSDVETQATIRTIRTLTEALGGVFLQRESDDHVAEIAHEGRAHAATQIVIGASNPQGIRGWFGRHAVDRLLAETTGADVHVCARPTTRPGASDSARRG
jgi:two-component system sensor histidine kinase KdpD